MVKRTCPNCGAELWSADSSGVWICPECGAEIGAEGVET
jgi:ribosomal protein L37AE/L43A